MSVFSLDIQCAQQPVVVAFIGIIVEFWMHPHARKQPYWRQYTHLTHRGQLSPVCQWGSYCHCRSSFNPLLIEAATAASRTAIPRYRETRPYCEVIVSAPSCFVYHPLTVRCSYRCWLLLTVVEKITPSRPNQIQIIIKNILAIKALRSERTVPNVRG